MTLTKRTSGRIYVLVLVATAALGTIIYAAAPPVDPLVGDWLFYRNHSVTFNADGTSHSAYSGSGTWEYLGNPEVQRHYRIVWNRGKSIDDLVLAEDGEHAHVRNEMGAHLHYNVRRAIASKPVATATPAAPAAAATPAAPAAPAAAPAAARAAGAPAAPADPILGAWQWSGHRQMDFKADGTVMASSGYAGTWTPFPNPGGARKYRVDWGHGGYIDFISLDPNDAQTASVESNKGPHYTVRRASGDKPADAQGSKPYFGAPRP